jgi:hypothetical protein
MAGETVPDNNTSALVRKCCKLSHPLFRIRTDARWIKAKGKSKYGVKHFDGKSLALFYPSSILPFAFFTFALFKI